MLGIRTMNLDTRIIDLNDGRGVKIVTGNADPITGVPDPALDVDFTITLGDTPQIDLNDRVAQVGASRLRAADVASMLPAGDPQPDQWERALTVSLSTGLTSTEAAAMGGFGGIISALVYRQLNWSLIKEAAMRTLRLTGMIMWILFGAYCFSAAYHGMGANQLMINSDFPLLSKSLE